MVIIVSSILLATAMLIIAALIRRLRALAAEVITDPLTGAFNRRHLATQLSAAVERRLRTGERASLLLLDLDAFKDVNDRFGHAEGDRVLKDLVARVRLRLRTLDAVFRIGGEEFGVLLSGAGFQAAWSVAEEVRAIVSVIRRLDGRRISISVGVAELDPADSVQEWIARADTALYRAKNTGRNRVAGDPPSPARLEFAARG